MPGDLTGFTESLHDANALSENLSGLVAQPFDADILIQLGPLETVTCAGNLNVDALGGSSMRKARVPSNWDRNDAPVLQVYSQGILCYGYIYYFGLVSTAYLGYIPVYAQPHSVSVPERSRTCSLCGVVEGLVGNNNL